jgi:prepilin-type processing-associated H-X9-DG protein
MDQISTKISMYESPTGANGCADRALFRDRPPGVGGQSWRYSIGNRQDPRWFHRTEEPQQGSNNMLFLDGRVECLSYSEHNQAVVNKDIHWNVDP